MTARASASEIAAAQVQLEFSKSGWLFHPLAADFGIDAQAESVDHGVTFWPAARSGTQGR